MMGLTRQSDAAYYALLTTQLDYLLYKPIETDSVINSAVDFSVVKPCFLGAKTGTFGS